MESLVFLVLIFGMGYFMIVRPQQKRQKERTSLLTQLGEGDDVVTIGGLHGRIDDITESTVDLVIAEDASGDPVLLRFDRQAVARVVPVETPERDIDELLHDDIPGGMDDLTEDHEPGEHDSHESDLPESELGAAQDGDAQDPATTVDVTDVDANADRD